MFSQYQVKIINFDLVSLYDNRVGYGGSIEAPLATTAADPDHVRSTADRWDIVQRQPEPSEALFGNRDAVVCS